MSKMWHASDVKDAERPRPAVRIPFRMAGMVAAVAVTATLCIQLLSQDNRVQSFARTGLSPAAAQALLDEQAPPQVLLAGAESLDLSRPGAIDLAVTMVRESLARQPDQPFAWVALAYFQTRKAGRVDAVALDALRQSVEQCGYCDKQLLRWRLGFAIDHWNDIPEDLRLEIFKGAEFLRWWHIDGAFLADAREKAEAKGINFRGYQQRVVSDIRPHEIMPRK